MPVRDEPWGGITCSGMGYGVRFLLWFWVCFWFGLIYSFFGGLSIRKSYIS